MGLDMMGLRDALTFDSQMSAPAHIMLREELRKPLDEARANQGNSGVFANARRAIPTGTVRTQGEEERMTGVMEYWTDGRHSQPVLQHSNTPIFRIRGATDD